MPRADLVLVVGMIRSGSSALTRVLSLCGCTLPQLVLGPQPWNPRGNWDPVNVLKLNTEFLLQHDTALGDPSMRIQEIAVDAAEKERFIGSIVDILAEESHESPRVIKEQCITELMDFWLSAAQRAGLAPKIMIPVRHPSAVLKSVAAARGTYGPATELTLSMWLKYNLLAERHSRHLPRVFVEYPNLMNDWRGEVGRISNSLDMDLDFSRSAAISGFLSDSLHHQKELGTITEPYGNSWLSQVYTTLSAASRDEPIDSALLDDIHDAYCSSERTFRIAHEAFRSRFNAARIRETHAGLHVWKSGQDF